MSHIKKIELAGDFVIDQILPVLLTIYVIIMILSFLELNWICYVSILRMNNDNESEQLFKSFRKYITTILNQRKFLHYKKSKSHDVGFHKHNLILISLNNYFIA